MALTLVGMQGVINRNGPTVYLDWGMSQPGPHGNVSRFWLSLLRQHIDVEYLDLDGLSAVNFLFQRYGSRFTGAVIYEPAVPDTINLATMLAGLENRMILAPEQLGLPGIPQFESVTDLRQLVKEQGWDITEDGKYRLYKWVYDNLWPRLEHRIIGVISPGPPTSREINSSGSFFPLGMAARDYIVALRLTALWLSPLDEPQASLLAWFLADAPSPIPVLGLFGNDEVGTVALASRYGDWVPAITIGNAPLSAGSLTVFSGVQSDLRSYQPEVDVDRLFAALGSKPVATIWSSDGDAINFQMDRGYHGLINFVWPDVQGHRFGWTINPTLADIAPLVWNYYVESRTKLSLLTGVSGAGYMYPSLMSDIQLRGFLEYTARYLNVTGLRVVFVDSRFGAFDSQAALYHNVLRNTGYLGLFTFVPHPFGLGFRYAGVPSPWVSARYTLNSTNGAGVINDLFTRRSGEILASAEDGQYWGRVIEDKDAFGGKAVFFSRETASCCLVVTILEIDLAPGKYVVNFRLKVPDNASAKRVAKVFVGERFAYPDWRIIAEQDIAPRDFKRAGQYQNFTLSFVLDRLTTDIEFRIDYYPGSTDMFADFIHASREGGLDLPIFAAVFIGLVLPPQRMTEAPQFAEDLERAGGFTLTPDEFLAALNPEFMIEWATPILGAAHPALVDAKAQLSAGDYFTSLLTVRRALRTPPERTYLLQVEDKGHTITLAVRADTWITDYTFNEAKRAISFRTHGPPSGTVQMLVTVPNELIEGPVLIQVDGRSQEFTRVQNATHTTFTLELPQGPHDILVQLKRQYLVEVISEFGNPVGTGLYVEETRVTISVNTPIGIFPGVRMAFEGWSGDISSSSNIAPITVDRHIRVSANWRKQFLLTVNADGGSVTGGGWYDAGKTASFSTISPHETVPAKTRLVFTKWAGDSTSDATTVTVLMSSPRTVSANWKTQHYLSVDPGPGEVGQGSQWLDEGATITITATTPSKVEPEKSRLMFVGWSGDITSTYTSTTLRINGPKMVVANWKVQYYLKVVSNLGNPQGEGWYDQGAEATFSVTSPLGTMVRDVFDSWTEDFTGKNLVETVLMDSTKRVVANWRKDYTFLIAVTTIVGAIAAVFGIALTLSRRRKQGS